MSNTLKWLLVGAALLICHKAQAEDWHIMDLQDLGINYRNYGIVNDKARNLLIYPEHPKEGIDVLLNTNILTYGYWDNRIETLTTSGQYRGIGLDTRLGIRVTENVQFGLWHRSQHTIDRAPATIGKFPSEDALELRIYLFQSRERRQGAF